MRPVPAPSPNRGPRRGGAAVRLVVLHYTGMASAAAALERLRDPGSQVSAHYLLDLDGTAYALVPEAERAWHAGAGAWGGIADVNSASVGIELQNRGDHPFPAPQMAALRALLADLLARHRLGPAAVIGHSDMAPGRKRDPGPRFDWRGLARAGLSVWPDPRPGEGEAAEPGAAFLAAAEAAGYRLPAGAGPDTLLAAFRLRFRPFAAGPAGERDVALARALARTAPGPGP